MRRHGVGRLLAWYPPAWRDRYGDELTALIEDLGPLSLRSRLGVMVSGARERVHEARRPRPPAERARAGVMWVLIAWAMVMVAGPSFANLADGFTRALPPHAGPASVSAYAFVAAFAVLGALAVLGGMAVAGPSFVRFLRAGGWESIRRPVRRALVATAFGAGAFAALVVMAHTLGPVQSSTWSLAAFCVVSASWVAVVGFWTTAAGTAWRRMDLSPRVLRIESALAVAAAGSMVLLTAAAAVWWGAVAEAAPWFLQVSPVHPGGSVLNPQALATEVLLTLGAVVALGGAGRAWRQGRLAG
jgi:hypothetical protein